MSKLFLSLILLGSCAESVGTPEQDGAVRDIGHDKYGNHVEAIDDLANGVTCYVVDGSGYRSTTISCVKVKP